MGNDALARQLTILIPAYNPDEKLLALLPKLKERFDHVVLVNDGSSIGKYVFERPRLSLTRFSCTGKTAAKAPR